MPSPEHPGADHQAEAFTSPVEIDGAFVEQINTQLADKGEQLTPVMESYVVPKVDAVIDPELGMMSVADPEDILPPLVDASGKLDTQAIITSINYDYSKIHHSTSVAEVVPWLQDMEAQGLVVYADDKPRTLENATFPYDQIQVITPSDQETSSSELYRSGLERIDVLTKIESGIYAPETFAVRAELRDIAAAERKTALDAQHKSKQSAREVIANIDVVPVDEKVPAVEQESVIVPVPAVESRLIQDPVPPVESTTVITDTDAAALSEIISDPNVPKTSVIGGVGENIEAGKYTPDTFRARFEAQKERQDAAAGHRTGSSAVESASVAVPASTVEQSVIITDAEAKAINDILADPDVPTIQAGADTDSGDGRAQNREEAHEAALLEDSEEAKQSELWVEHQGRIATIESEIAKTTDRPMIRELRERVQSMREERDSEVGAVVEKQKEVTRAAAKLVADTLLNAHAHRAKSTLFDSSTPDQLESAEAYHKALKLEDEPFLVVNKGGMFQREKNRGPKIAESYYRTATNDHIVVVERRLRGTGELISQLIMTSEQPIENKSNGDAKLPRELKDDIEAVRISDRILLADKTWDDKIRASSKKSASTTGTGNEIGAPEAGGTVGGGADGIDDDIPPRTKRPRTVRGAMNWLFGGRYLDPK